MSIWFELAEFLSGALSEYAQKNRWSKRRMFMAMSSMCFALFTIYVVLTPSPKSIWVGISIAGAFGFSMGLLAVLLMWLAEWHKSRRPKGRE